MNKLGRKESSPTDEKEFPPRDVFDAGMQHHNIANTAWPIAHNKTMAYYRVSEADLQQHIIDSWKGIDDMCLYVHIPFCEKICNFCEYSVMNPAIKAEQEPIYFEALAREIELYRERIGTETKRLIGFDIGGGTPSSVDSRYIGHIMDQVTKNFSLAPDMTLSIETTPKIAAEDIGKIRDYFAMGIRRISMGIQTISPQTIGRESTSLKWNREAVKNIRTVGFEQFNVDLMFGFANQTVKDVEASVEHALSLYPDFVTLYRMRYKGTNVEAKAAMVDLEEVNRQYDVAIGLLGEAGYEVRNGKNTFSKIPGNDGLSDYLHNRVERGVPYLGVGQGAQSFNPYSTLAYNRGASLKHPFPYYQKLKNDELPVESAHHLGKKAAMAKMIAVSFYSGGIHRESFKQIFGESLEEAFPEEVAFVKEHGFMEEDERYGTLQLTKEGNEVYSGIIALFYNGEVKEHLLTLGENKWMKGLGKRERRTGKKG